MSVQMDAYARIPFAASGLIFAYALHFKDSNSIQFGIGFESRSGLDRKHICTHTIHENHIDDFIDQIRGGAQVRLDTGSLADHLDGAAHINLEDFVEPAAITQLLAVVAEEAWDAPFGMVQSEIALEDGAFLWVLFDRSEKRFKIGCGLRGPSNEAITGETCYSIPVRDLERFAAELYRAKTPLPLPGRAVTLVGSAPNSLGATDQKRLAKELVHLFDLHCG